MQIIKYRTHHFSILTSITCYHVQLSGLRTFMPLIQTEAETRSLMTRKPNLTMKGAHLMSTLF